VGVLYWDGVVLLLDGWLLAGSESRIVLGGLGRVKARRLVKCMWLWALSE